MANHRDVLITEVCLRDGSHVLAHQYTKQQVHDVTKALDESGVPYIEVTHGDGLGGSSIQYGFSLCDELDLIEEAAAVVKQSKIAVLLLPGIGTIEMLKEAYERGARVVRVATHVTEADISMQHIQYAKQLGMETVGFLMMAHSVPPEKLLEQAKLMESYGADVVYVTDSAGALLPHEVRERIRLLKDNMACDIGFHGHNNLSVAVANSLVAYEEGARRLDGSLRCLGAGAGNTQTEVLVAIMKRLGINTGIDLYKIMDTAEYIVAPLLPRPQEINQASLVLGYAGVYSSFLLHAERAAKKFGVDVRDILIEIGNRRAVGGQEDMIIDVALDIAREKQAIG